MSTSSKAAKDQLVKALCDDEEILFKLSKTNAVELSEKMFRRCIISDNMKDQFSSLDHSRVDPQLQVRYLLRLVSWAVQKDESVWEKFLSLLSSMGQGQLYEYLRASTAEVRPVGTKTVSSDSPLSEEDISCLLELLVSVSYKWELIGRALGLSTHEIENCRSGVTDNKIIFSHVLSCWLARDPTVPPAATLNNLKKVLKSQVVGEGRIAADLEDRFSNTKKGKTSSSIDSNSLNSVLTITYQSTNTDVADGKSTLLLVQASPRESLSYQWKKDGQPLANGCTYSGVEEDILVVSHACQGTEGHYTCCVSNQEREVCSSKITLSVIYSPAKWQLLSLYSVQTEVPPDSWPPVGTKMFINLVLTKSSTELLGDRDYSACGDMDKSMKKKEKVEYEEIFGEYRSGELLVVEGCPGSGKTTLVQKIIKDWSRGKILQKAELVFLVSLRILSHGSRAESLSSILELFYDNDEDLKEASTVMKKAKGKGVCFIFDGLDEYSPQDKRKSMIHKLLDKTYLPLAMIIVSSRPVATKILQPAALTSRIEVFGFTKENILEYVDSFPFNTGLSGSNAVPINPTNLKEYLHLHPNVFDMCYLPVHAAMICFLYKHLKGDIPYTQTKIYEEFTKSMILRQLNHHDEAIKVHSLNNLDGSVKEHFLNLCLLAYNMTIHSKQVVTQDEVCTQFHSNGGLDDKWSLGLVTINHVAQLYGTDKTYTFLHLTLQEFLAAFHITTLETEEQCKIIQKCVPFSRTHLHSLWSSTVLTFYCGLMDYECRAELVQHIANIIFPHTMDHRSRLIMLQCAFESQQPVFCDAFVSSLKGEISSNFVAPPDISALGYVISATSQPIRLIHLPYQSTQFLQQVCRHDFSKLQMLQISSFIDDAGMQPLAGVLKSCKSLVWTDLNFTHVSTEGLTFVANSFKHLSSLKHLHIEFVQPCSGFQTLYKELQLLSNIELSLSFQDLLSTDVVNVCRGFHFLSNISIGLHLHCKESLTLEEATFPNEIQCLTKLRDLFLNDLNIVPDSIIPLARRLHVFMYLSNLYLSQNVIGPNGCAALANGVQHLTNLKCLRLCSNHIGPAGAAALSNVLHCVPKLSELYMSNNEIGPSGAISLSKGLLHLTELEELCLDKNSIDVYSALSIIRSVKKCGNLSILNINKQDQLEYLDGIYVTGLVSSPHDVIVSHLLGAAQHDTHDRELHFGSEHMKVPSKKSLEKEEK